jgi:hypothetical protein
MNNTPRQNIIFPVFHLFDSFYELLCLPSVSALYLPGPYASQTAALEK